MHSACGLDEYFNAGTIPGAISAITTQAGAAQMAADAVLRARLPTEAEPTQQLKDQGMKLSKAAQTASSDLLDACLTQTQDGRRNTSPRLKPRCWAGCASRG